MQTTFLNAAGTVLFARDDMEKGEWTQEEYTVNAVFPFVLGKKIEMGMQFYFRDPATNNLETFEIRNVTNVEPDHCQQIIAEHIVIAELSDEHINETKITDKTPTEALTTALTGTLWSVGNITGSDQNSVDIERGDVWQAVNAIAQNWNLYIIPRVTVNSAGNITGRYIDASPAQGTWRGVRLSVDKNMSDASVTYDDSNVLTALYGYGASVGKSHTTGDDTQETLTFTDVTWAATSGHPAKPNGQTYIEDPAKTAIYGRNGRPRFGYYQNGDIKDAEILLEKTWESLKNTCDPTISITGTVTDLYRLGYKDQPIRLHDTVIVEIRQTGETFQKEIIKLTVDLLDQTATRPTIGDYIPNIIYINRKANKGGGGGGGRGQTNEEEKETWFDSEFIRESQLIGMVVGLKDGQGYIKAASIIASINDDGGTNIKLTADTIDIDGLLSAFETEAITCGNLNCGGSIDVDQDISAGGTISSLVGSFDELFVADSQATWQDTEVVTNVTASGNGQQTYALSSNGTSVTGTISQNVITTVSKTTATLHYLGSAPT